MSGIFSLGLLATACLARAERPDKDHAGKPPITDAFLQCHQDVGVENSSTPVSLLIFDMDETLTLATWPADVEKSFENPWASTYSPLMYPDRRTGAPPVQIPRIEKLQNMLGDLQQEGRVMAVLTRNTGGSESVRNMLIDAGLSKYFDAVWCVTDERQDMSLRSGEQWSNIMDTPLQPGAHKADIVKHIVDRDGLDWFPRVLLQDAELKFDGVVLVDDDPDNFASPTTKARLSRYCLVQTYNYVSHLYYGEVLADCGVRDPTKLGGIGARTDADFVYLKAFVDNPGAAQFQQEPTLRNWEDIRQTASRWAKDGGGMDRFESIEAA